MKNSFSADFHEVKKVKCICKRARQYLLILSFMIASGGEGKQAKDLRCCEQKGHSNQNSRLKWDCQKHGDVNKEAFVPKSCEGMSYSLHGESAHLSAP